MIENSVFYHFAGSLCMKNQPLSLSPSLSFSFRLVGVSQSSVLCFVVDTTGSMSDDIAEVKRVSFSIIDLKRGTQKEPSEYILVPFNDPGQTSRGRTLL